MKKITTLVLIMGFSNCLCALYEDDLERARDLQVEVANNVTEAGQAGREAERAALLENHFEYDILEGTTHTGIYSRIPKWMSYTTFCIVFSVSVVAGIEVYGALKQHAENPSNSTGN